MVDDGEITKRRKDLNEGKIMESVRSLKTFQNLNVQSFRKIGTYCIAITILNLITYLDLGTFTQQSLYIETTPLIIGLFAFILAEIFKEGNHLMQENELTV